MPAKAHQAQGPRPKALCALSLLACAVFAVLAWSCGAGESGSSGGSASADRHAPMPRDQRVKWTARPDPLSVKLKPVELTDLDFGGTAVPVVDRILATYHRLIIAVIVNVDGEVFPCGCSDGQVGGLVGLMPKLVSMQPALVAGLGDNYLPRSIPTAAVQRSAAYFNARMAFVQEALGRDRRILEVFSPAEAGLSGIAGSDLALQRVNLEGTTLDIALARSETWTGAEQLEKSVPGTLRVLLLGGESLRTDASFAGFDQVLWFRSPMSSAGLPRNVSLIARPFSGGRGVVQLSLLLPMGTAPSGKLMFLDEVRTLRTAIARIGQQDVSAAHLRQRLERRAEELLESRPILLGTQQVSITSEDPIDHELYAKYAAFLARHSAEATGDLVAIAPDRVNAKCATCHAEYVKQFEAKDAHYGAMRTLRRVGKGGDPFCISCHITPAAIEAGRSIGEPQILEGVQCQWCHQSAEQHASMPYKIKPKAATDSVCAICHNQNQSPKYAWDHYVRRLSCYVVKRNGGADD